MNNEEQEVEDKKEPESNPVERLRNLLGPYFTLVDILRSSGLEKLTTHEAIIAKDALSHCNHNSIRHWLDKLSNAKEVEGQSVQESQEEIDKNELVEWIVNDNGELGVRIGERFLFLYKGYSIEYTKGHDDGSPMYWRPVYKREFGECCHPAAYFEGKMTLNNFKASAPDNYWKQIPTRNPL